MGDGIVSYEPVSVVITCYNLSRYIGYTIQSVLGQDYEGDIEIIVVDDASQDNSRGVVEQFPGIIYVRRSENGGVLSAMLDGICRASHEIIMFLDGDDIWAPEKVRLCVAAFTPGVALVTHDLVCIDQYGENIRVDRISSASKETRGSTSERLRELILGHQRGVWLGSAFCIHATRARVSHFVEFCRASEYLTKAYQDWPLAVWVALQYGLEIALVDRPLLKYRVHLANYSGDSRTTERKANGLSRASATQALIADIVRNARGAREIEERAEMLRRGYEMYASVVRSGINSTTIRYFLSSARSELHAAAGGWAKVLPYVVLGSARGHRLIQWVKALARIR